MSAKISSSGGGAAGPGSSTDNAVVVYDGTTGQLFKDSSVTLISGALGNVASVGFATGGGLMQNPSTGNYRLQNTSGRGLELDVTIFSSLGTYRKWAFPVNAGDTFVGVAATQTLTAKTLTDPIFGGGATFKGLTESAAGASTTELPNSKDFSLHKNTSSGAVHLAYNDGGVVKSVQLT